MSENQWQVPNCLLQLSTDIKACTGCNDRDFTCKKCGGPVFRVGFYGDGMDCYHCDAHYSENYKGLNK